MDRKERNDVGHRDDPESLRERVARLEQENARLAGSEERFEILFEDAPDGCYLSDLKGTFIDGNAAAEVVTGYERDELIGKSFLSLKLLSPADVLRAASLLARNLLGHSTGPDEFTLSRKDGSTVPVEIRTHPVRIGGRRLVLGIARDVSARKQVEHQLRERAKELRAIYDLSEIAEREGISLDEVCQALADILPRSWQHEEIACARIFMGGREFRTKTFVETPWRQSAPVRVGGV
ncbi:MAG: PAS domain S-box protein, partial [Candidatus Bipolaricaulota bacterium]|nr:PAS domain S-box protein [Candidatus Bipolaricaulota bacterium]